MSILVLCVLFGVTHLIATPMGISRLVGTVLAHLCLVPGAFAIAQVARWIPA